MTDQPSDYMAQQYKEREQCRVIDMPHPHEVFLAQIDELRADVQALREENKQLKDELEAWRTGTRH